MIQPVLAEHIKGPVADQLVDIPVPLVMEEIVAVVQEVVRLVPREREQQRIGEKMVEVLVPQFFGGQ